MLLLDDYVSGTSYENDVYVDLEHPILPAVFCLNNWLFWLATKEIQSFVLLAVSGTNARKDDWSWKGLLDLIVILGK